MSEEQRQRLINQNQVQEDQIQEDRDKNEGEQNQDYDDGSDEGDQSLGDEDDALTDEDYDPDIKDDILRPASTRSKIVVNLEEPETKGKKKQVLDDIKYKLDPYDKVRMQLIFENCELYNAYTKTISELETRQQYQPRKRKMPCYMEVPGCFLEFILIVVLGYIFFLIIQLALFNLVIIGIICVMFKNIWQFLEAARYKCKFKYRTKDFMNFIDQQNKDVYSKMKTPIEIQYEREGCWLEFLLKDEEKMFEEEIANRREQIFKLKNTAAIDEMKQILNQYSQEKNKQEEQNNANKE